MAIGETLPRGMGEMFMKMLKFMGLIVVVAAGYLLLWPVAIDPIAWNAPQTKGYVGDFSPNEKLKALKFVDFDTHIGPEDVAFGSDGKIYAATHDGIIIRVDPVSGDIEDFADTGGRPLGIEFGPNGNLYVADAYRGLLKISAGGDVELLSDKSDDGITIRYADDLDVTRDGVVYFSDASVKFGAKVSGGTLLASLLDLMEHGPHGRILKYDPATGKTETLLSGYSFANGVALANDETYFLFAETGTYSVHKHWLSGEKKGQTEMVMENLPGFPDNINANADGTYWLGLVSPRSPPVDALAQQPFVRKIVQRLPAVFRPKPMRYGFVVRIDGDGKVIETLQDPPGDYALTTGAIDGPDGSVVVSSLTEKRLGILAPK